MFYFTLLMLILNVNLQSDLEIIATDDECLKTFTRNITLWDADTIIVLTPKDSIIEVHCWRSSNLVFVHSVQDDSYIKLYTNDIYLDGKLVFPSDIEVYLLECEE